MTTLADIKDVDDLQVAHSAAFDMVPEYAVICTHLTSGT